MFGGKGCAGPKHCYDRGGRKNGGERMPCHKHSDSQDETRACTERCEKC